VKGTIQIIDCKNQPVTTGILTVAHGDTTIDYDLETITNEDDKYHWQIPAVENEEIITLTYTNKNGVSTSTELNKNGLPYELEMARTSDMSKIYGYIRSMAIGYATEGGELYKNEELFNDIIGALDYMHENYYNRREEKIFSGFDNWWDWEIGSPENYLDALFCICEDLPEKILNKYLEPINRYDPFPSMTMSNRINIAYVSIFSSVLQKDYKRIARSIEMFRECFGTTEKSDGFYEDGSFIQHGYYSYIGEYGDEMMTALSIISYSLDDSVFRLDEEMKKYQYKWIINSFLPSMYNGGYMDLVRGRSISRNIKGDQSGKLTLNMLCLMIDYLTEEESINYLKSIVKYVYILNKPYLRYVLTQLL
jgi:hyaluronate lyase